MANLLQAYLNEIKSQKDTYLLPENLKKDVSLLGVTGTLESGEISTIPVSTAEFLFSAATGSTASTFQYLYDYLLPCLDVSSCTSFYYCFRANTLCTSIDISSWNMSAATRVDAMFYGCTNLIDIILPGLNGGLITRFSSMFSDCSSLTSLDVSGFDTSAGTNFSYMFSDCSSLTSLDVSGFDTSAGTAFNYMFSGCSRLTDLDISNFVFNSPKSGTSYMFLNCSGLTSITLPSGENISINHCTSMFEGCSNLTELDLSTYPFNVDAGSMGNGAMFKNCSNLVTLDISGANHVGTFTSWDNVEDDNSIVDMFEGCTALETVYVQDEFVKAWVDAGLNHVGLSIESTIKE